MRHLLCLLLVLLAHAAFATEPLSITTTVLATGTRAAQPSVAVDPREGFVLTWQERDDEGDQLLFAVIGRDGVERRRGRIARGHDWFINGADFPNLVVLDNGDWVSFYLQKTAPDTYAYAIDTLRSRDAGASWDAPVRIHRDGTDTEHGFVSLLAAGDDVVRAVWLDGRHMATSGSIEHGEHDGDHDHEAMTLRSAALGRNGVLFDEFELDPLTCACCQTSAVRVGERSVVAYRDRSEAEQRDIHWLEHGSGGWTKPRSLHADGWIIAACPVNGPALASADGRIAAIWPTMAQGEMRVLLALGIGERFAAPTILAEGPSELGRVDIAAWPRHQWLALRVHASEHVPALLLSVLDRKGKPLWQQQIATRVGGFPRLASMDEVALLAWAESRGQPGETQIGTALVRAPGSAEPLP